MDLRTIFKRLGYPKHSHKVYEVLVNTKTPLLVTNVAEQCKVSRVVVYRCLEKLVNGGLIIENKKGKRSADIGGSPRILREAIRIADIESGKVTQSLISEREKDTPKNVRFLYGPDGIRAAFDDVIHHTKNGETFFRYTSEQVLEKVNSYLSKDYRSKRDKKKLERVVISNHLSGQQKKSRLERFVHFLPENDEQFEQNIIQLIYGNHISMIDLSKEEVIIVENKRLADFQKSIFKALYKNLKS